MASYRELRQLALVCLFSAALSHEVLPDKVNKIFGDLEESQHELKEVFYDMIKKDEPTTTTEKPTTTEQQTCMCVPFYLCNADTHEVIKDGKFLLETRLNECSNPQDVCCGKDRIGVPSQTRIAGVKEAESQQADKQKSKCGLGHPFPNNYSDPTLSQFGEFAWTVVIKKGKNYTCAGSLIHPAVVLTSAHCLNSTEGVFVRAGDWHLLTREEPSRHQISAVKNIIKHPDFRFDNLIYDVALLILDEAFDLADHINTICLAKPTPEPLVTSVTDTNQCVTSGWGVIEPDGQNGPIMRKVYCVLADSGTCQEEFRTSRLGKWFELHQSFICAHGQNQLDVCVGNGGSPLACPSSDEPERFQLVGVTSWGIGCGTGLPTVFAKVSQVRQWIDSAFDVLGFSKEYYNYK